MSSTLPIAGADSASAGGAGVNSGDPTAGLLSQRYVSEYPYKRTLGPVLGRFFAGLSARRFLGVRATDGKVLVPPSEYDPRSGEALGELVDVGPEGVVTSWTWIAEPRPKHPLTHPFAFALVRLDGADTAMLHAVDARSPERMETGMRVRPRWTARPSGGIRDVECFVPCDGEAPVLETSPLGSPAEIAPLHMLTSPLRLDYDVHAGRATTRYLRSLAEGRLVGQRCPRCNKVYMPPRGCCPTCGVATEEEVPVADTGTVTTFCIVNVPSDSLSIPIPYVASSILLDGADTSIFHLIRDIPAAEVRMGLRVKAVWAPPEKLGPTLTSILHFSPNGEPDAPWESYQGAL